MVKTEKKIKVTLVKSLIGSPQKRRRTVKTLGLGKISSSAVHTATPDILGKINQVAYLLKVEEV